MLHALASGSHACRPYFATDEDQPLGEPAQPGGAYQAFKTKTAMRSRHLG